ncbi:MAG: hypothetical protein JSW22_00135 [Chloroflexota bacterium]|nr:MAG: hypothetical protein JSW22_00135 [Chloroflexota bacterium]
MTYPQGNRESRDSDTTSDEQQIVSVLHNSFDPGASPVFIYIWGLPTRTQANVQPEPPD